MDNSHRNVAPSAVLQQAISKFEQEEPGHLATFSAAPRFQGARPGYYFGRGASGVGYYLDSKQQPPTQHGEEAAEEAGAAGGRQAAARPMDADELLREAEEAAGDAGMEMLDARGLKRLTLALERKYNANMEARMKYADQPDKFLESEADLDEAVKAMLVVATAPDLYPELARSSAVPTLLALLNHENGDIAADAVEVLSELTSGDVVEDAEEEAAALVECLLEADALSLLVHRLSGFDEKVAEEAAAVNGVLCIVENMIEVKPEVAELAVEQTKLLKWLLSRLRQKEADSNKQYASEILAIIVQHSDANKRKMGATNGVDAVLQAIAPYRNRDPQTAEEEEVVENLFDVVASCLLLPQNKAVFVEAEGVELLLLILKSKRATRTSALKCLDFATSGCPSACDRVVDQQGLKTLFAIFMGKLKVKKMEDSAAGEEEERTVSIISSLLLNIAKQARRDRVAAKFVENEFEKCDRLMEVYFRYEARVAAEEARLAADAGAEQDLDEDEMLLARMDAGLYTLQQCALVVGSLWLVGDVGVRKRILRCLHQKGRTLASLRSVLLEYRANLGDEGDVKSRAQQVEQATKMLLALGHTPTEEEEEQQAAEAAEAAAAAANGGATGAAAQEAAAALPPAAPAVPAEDDDVDMDVEEGEQPQPTQQEQQGKQREEDERRRQRREAEAGEAAAAAGRGGGGGRDREEARRRSRSRSPERERKASRLDRDRRSRSRSPGKDRDDGRRRERGRRERDCRRSRSRSRERRHRDDRPRGERDRR